MLAPMFLALALSLTPPAPPAQLCFGFDADAVRICQQQQRQQQQLDDQQRRLDQLEQQQRTRQWEQTYTTPALTLPSSAPSYSPPALTLPSLSPSSSGCSLSALNC